VPEAEELAGVVVVAGKASTERREREGERVDHEEQGRDDASHGVSS